MSILVHPDKNLDDTERAQKAFDGKIDDIKLFCGMLATDMPDNF